MKKIVTILCVLLLVLTLFGCGGPIRHMDHYSVGEGENGYSVLYTDDKGNVEEIVSLGSTPQPLVIVKGRIYFTEPGALVSVDLNGKDRQTLAVDPLPQGSWIAYMDETHFYCIAGRSDLTCYQVDIAMTAYEVTPLPRSYRTVDYDALLQTIRTQVAAEEDHIRVRSARVEMDGNGTPVAMTLEVISDGGKVSGMEFWNNGTVTVALPIGSMEASYQDLHVPLSLADWTIERTIALEDFLTAVETVDKAEIAAGHACGTAEGFVLAYLQEEYDALAAEGQVQAWLGVSGAEVAADASARYFVLGQTGGADTVLTDSRGTAVGNLLAVRLDG